MVAMRKIVVMALMAAACTPLEWSKPGAGPEQVANDNDFCQREASREAPVHTPHLPPIAAVTSASSLQPAKFDIS